MEEMKTILVVDDDKVLLLDAKRKLQDSYKVVGVPSGKLALEYLKSHTPDLILLDVMMPDMDGFELLDTIKSGSRTKKIPVIFLTADTTEQTEIKCLECGAIDFLAKPIVAPIMHVRVKHALMLADYANKLESQVENQIHRISVMQNDVLSSLANLIESRDLSTGGHVKRTAQYVAYLLKRMIEDQLYSTELCPNYIANVIHAAPLHDIGKIMVSDIILNKPGKFTSEEYEEMKKHSAEGRRLILANMDNLAENDFVTVAANMAGYHHERWNGNGYPEKLSGKEIPLCARIMAIADVFDALTSKRVYKDLIPFEDAVEIMRRGKGTDFEDCLVDCFLSNLQELEQETLKIQHSLIR